VTRRTPRHRLEGLLFRLLVAKWSILPESLALKAGEAVGWLAGSLLRVRRRDVERHLAWAFPDRSPSWRRAVARASYRHLGREAVVLFRRGGWSRERILERTAVVGFEAFREDAEAGHGVILLTGHLGNWEIGGAGIAARGIPLDVVGKGMADRRFEEHLFETRARLGMRVVEMGEAPREALRSLAEGRVVALLGDQNAHRGGIFVPFFGRQAATVRGPALLAARTGARVWVGFATRDPGPEQRYTLRFQPLPFEPTGVPEEEAVALMGAYGAELEEAVKAAPEQYFWQHRRWKRRPPEEPGSER
jgi:KDO2-lipid IV(A) lauroyltransferase